MDNIGKNFIEYTKLKNLKKSDEDKGLAEPPIEKELSQEENIIELPDPELGMNHNFHLQTVIGNRKSIRNFSAEPLSKVELSYLLWNTQGIKRKSSNNSVTKRTVPSAGARHPLETYLYVQNVEDLQQGIYRYIAGQHNLSFWKPIKQGTKVEDLEKACYQQKFVGECAVTFIWTAVVERTTWRYGERGYRYLFLDAGHVCQNLYLSVENINSGACAIGAYDDEMVHEILDIDGEKEFAIYLASVGKKISRS
ncbi:SagB/ThcOx family dehydrogenase [Natranaerobius thermophilus]|uniref:Nitroreductase n=1 Tax=Natranaerobius thermophilus (strain ATCC BAA-1301 / DSM 18059 / JW/NM-WN-LF) TaxID=457570 RepID=B2A5G8_NATTJ|nr:SagB/ThcOx family dehydrogenase [Natranaerobius thermophilus]ACB85323.1 nitroreductase [Natranaerobius thermophilus JW/NM-WN-LF]